MPQQGDMWFRIMFDHRKAVAGMKLTGRELQEIRILAGDLAGTVGNLVPQFDKLTRLARADGEQMQVVAASFAKVAYQSQQNEQAARAYIRQLRQEVNLLRQKKIAGKELTEQEKVMLAQNLRIADQFEVALAKNTQSIKKRSTAMSAMQKQLLGLAKQIAVITISYKAFGEVVDSIKLALDIEKAQKQFEIFLQSASEAEFVMDRIRRIAAETPLTISVSTQATRTLLQYGITAGEVTTRLRQLGDIAGGDTERLQRLSLAFGQITAAGRLQGQELRQLVEAGFNPLSEISRTTGESMLDLKLRMAAGSVSANEIAEALKIATTNGGRFAGQLERVASETTAGRLMLIAGAFEEMKIEAGELVHEMKPVLDAFIAILQARRFAVEAGLISLKGTTTLPGAEKLTFLHLVRGMVGDTMQAAAGIAVQAEKANQTLLASLQDQTVEMIAQFNQTGELLNITQEEFKLKKLIAELGAEEMDAEALKLKNAYELLKARKQEHELQQRAAEIARSYEDPRIKLQRQLQEVMSMQGRGMLPQGIARQETDRLTQEFINAQVDKIVASQKEAAQVATKGSTEEFQIMRDIAMKNADSADSREETRHKARMEAQEALKNAVEALPEEISALLPQAVAG